MYSWRLTIIIELIGDPPISEEWQDNGSEEQTKELSENEMQIAKFAMDAMLSTRHYAMYAILFLFL